MRMEVALYKISPFSSEAPSHYHFPKDLDEFVSSCAISSRILNQWTQAPLLILKISYASDSVLFQTLDLPDIAMNFFMTWILWPVSKNKARKNQQQTAKSPFPSKKTPKKQNKQKTLKPQTLKPKLTS